MLYGEHLCAEEVPLTCPCGVFATAEVFDKSGQSHGWFCRTHARRLRRELRKQEKIARAIVMKGTPR